MYKYIYIVVIIFCTHTRASRVTDRISIPVGCLICSPRATYFYYMFDVCVCVRAIFYFFFFMSFPYVCRLIVDRDPYYVRGGRRMSPCPKTVTNRKNNNIKKKKTTVYDNQRVRAPCGGWVCVRHAFRFHNGTSYRFFFFFYIFFHFI